LAALALRAGTGIILFDRNGLHCDDAQKAVMMLTPDAAVRPKRSLSDRRDQKMR
jgi:hypothetical protein